MLDGQKITIIGAGIAGLAVAVALAKRGANVHVLEQASEITEVGAGLQITPNGVAVLDALGLGPALRQVATVSESVMLRDYRRGSQVVKLDMMPNDTGRPYLLLHRADLVDLLADAAKTAGVTIRLDSCVDKVTEVKDGNEITLRNGNKLSADMLIGADGLHSRLRPVYNGVQKPFFTGQVAWRAMVAGCNTTGVNVYMGPGRHLVSYPLRGGEMTNIVAVEERRDWVAEGWNHTGDVNDLRQGFAHFCPKVQDLLAKVQSPNLWGLFRHPVATHWHGKSSALIGDAAHPTLPFLAQGANMALEDAWVLADCLGNAPKEQALPRYQSLRRERVCKVINAANANAKNYHLRNPLIRFAAHSGLRLIGSVAPDKLVRRFDWVYHHDVTQPAK